MKLVCCRISCTDSPRSRNHPLSAPCVLTTASHKHKNAKNGILRRMSRLPDRIIDCLCKCLLLLFRPFFKIFYEDLAYHPAHEKAFFRRLVGRLRREQKDHDHPDSHEDCPHPFLFFHTLLPFIFFFVYYIEKHIRKSSNGMPAITVTDYKK